MTESTRFRLALAEWKRGMLFEAFAAQPERRVGEQEDFLFFSAVTH
jgi:hypothetical protein